MRWVIAAAVGLGLAFGITQAVLPQQAEKEVEDRLTQDGGRADVAVRALPAIRLLFDDGDKLEVDARRVEIPVEDLQGGSFRELDGFDQVDVQIRQSQVGPFRADTISLQRDEGDDVYDFSFRGSTSVDDIANFALGTLPPVLRSLIDALGGRPASEPIGITLRANLRSIRGRARVEQGAGSVAGIPLGGLALPIAGAIISRLTG